MPRKRTDSIDAKDNEGPSSNKAAIIASTSVEIQYLKSFLVFLSFAAKCLVKGRRRRRNARSLWQLQSSTLKPRTLWNCLSGNWHISPPHTKQKTNDHYHSYTL